MKKKIRSAAALLMAVIILAALCSCGSSATQIKMATGGTAGTYYGFSGVIAQVLNEKLKDDINVTVESTGASKANIQLIENGDDSLAIVQNDVMFYAYTGTDMFSKPVTNFSAVLSCYPEIVQIVAAPDITSIDQLKGKSVSVGAADSGTRYNAEQILAAYGISFGDIDVVYESFADSADSMKNGTIDACFVVAGTPTTAITELATSYKFNLLGVDDEHLAALQSKYGFYTAVTVAADTYSCLTGDVQCAAVMATIIASNDLKEDAVYSFLKGLFDYKDEISAAHNKGNELDLNTAVSGISIPFHPGAQKFYAEKGISIAK
ncbi:MAG: TAXI family TRAP transporter solute-binding subunit [Oscillospiraceae bacterium]|nr:TAXI family TRAP transporter solute-binding subunit [Oscillospiraceae bacterium]